MDILTIRPPSGGAGTEINVKSNDVPSAPGEFGSSVIVGAFAKGSALPEVHIGGRGHYLRLRKGDLLREDEAPLNCQDFYAVSGGKGTLVTLRVTDGHEACAALPMFDRNVDLNVWATDQASKVNGKVGTLTAASAGTWGGARYYFGGSVADDSVALVVINKFATGLTDQWTVDELKGRTFTIDGDEREWLITGNTAAGVISVRGDFSSYAVTSGPVRYRIYGEGLAENGAERCLSALFGDGGQDPSAAFALNVFEDGKLQPNDWTDMSLDETDERYYEALINTALTDRNQFEVSADNDFAGDVLEELKPANFAEIPAAGSAVNAGVIHFNIWRFLRTGTGEGYAHTFTQGAAMVAHYYVLTFTAATTYTVRAFDFNDNEIALSLPGGTLATPYVAPDPHLSGHTVTANGAAHVAGDTITIYCRALPDGIAARGGMFYPYAFGSTGGGGKDVTRAYRIVSNDADSITLLGGEDLTDVVIPPGQATATGTSAWPTTKDTTGKTFIYDFVNNGTPVGAPTTLTIAGGATKTVEETVDELNTEAHPDHLVTFSTYTTAAGAKYLRVARSTGDYGPDTGLKITTGTLNTPAGFANNLIVTGAIPTVCRVAYRQEFEGGKDGHHDIQVSDYTRLFDVMESPLLNLRQYNLGLLKIAIPGISDEDIQQSLINFCGSYGFRPIGEFPTTTADEPAAGTWLRSKIVPTGGQCFSFPSCGYRKINPWGGPADFLSSLSGSILGVEAREAVNRSGYVKAPAGQAFDVGMLFKRLPTDTAGAPSPVKDYLLNPVGIRAVVHTGKQMLLYGDQVAEVGYKGRRWLHKMDCLLHIAQELVGFTQFDYETIDQTLRNEIVSTVYALLGRHFDAGWFKGADVYDACRVSSNASNNTRQTENQGKTICDISFQLKDTNMRTVLNISTSGVSVS